MSEVPQYYEYAATRIMRDLPRFGHAKDFSLIAGSKEQRQDYLYGLLFAGVFVIAFFLAWSVILAVFKCLGKNKVGYLSGEPFKVPKESRMPRRIRISFIIEAIVLVIFAVLLVTKGLTQVKTGVGNVYDSAVTWNNLVAEVEALLNLLVQAVKTSLSSQEQLEQQLVDGICQGGNIDEATGINVTGIVQNVSSVLGNALTLLNDTNVEDLQAALAEYEEITANMAETSDNISLGSWQSLIFLIPFPTFCTFLLIGVFMTWRRRTHKWYSCFLTWGVLPLFGLLIFICYLLCGSIAIAASANADFCSGGQENTPQRTILDMMLIAGHSTEETTFKLINFYVTTCIDTGGDPVPFLADFEDDLTPAADSVEMFNQAILNVTEGEFANICGEESFNALSALLLSAETTIVELSNVTGRTLELLACETILPIFTSAMWDGACQYSVQGVTWSFASFLVIAMMGMLMIMFRSSLLPTEYIDDADKLGGILNESGGDEEGGEVVASEQSPENVVQEEAATMEPLEPEESSGGEGTAVVTGVAVGAAAASAGAAATGGDDDEQANSSEGVGTATTVHATGSDTSANENTAAE